MLILGLDTLKYLILAIFFLPVVVLGLALNMLNFAWEKMANLEEAGSYFGMLSFTLDCNFSTWKCSLLIENAVDKGAWH